MTASLTPEAIAARDAGRAKIQGKILGGWQEFDAGFDAAAAHYTAETERHGACEVCEEQRPLTTKLDVDMEPVELCERCYAEMAEGEIKRLRAETERQKEILHDAEIRLDERCVVIDELEVRLDRASAELMRYEDDLSEARQHRDAARTETERLRAERNEAREEAAAAVVEADQLRGLLTEIAIPCLRYGEEKCGHDDQARLNLEAGIRLAVPASTEEESS
jgi:hypothetical protein